MSFRKIIAVYPPPDGHRIARLFRCLGAAFDVDFLPLVSLDLLRHEAVLLLADDDASLLKTLPFLSAVFSAPGISKEPKRLSGEARFSRDAALAAPFHGQTLACALETTVGVAELTSFTPLLSVGEVPVWMVSTDGLRHRSNIPVN